MFFLPFSLFEPPVVQWLYNQSERRGEYLSYQCFLKRYELKDLISLEQRQKIRRTMEPYTVYVGNASEAYVVR